MNGEGIFRHRRAARVAVAQASAATCAMRQQWASPGDAFGSALEVGQVEHWDSIEHIEYGNYVHEFDIGGGNACGPGSAYDWTGEQK